MPALVRDVMNEALFALRREDPAEGILSTLLGLGITAAPVLDGQGRPLGVVSLRDLVSRSGRYALERMSAPAVVVHREARVEEAARLMAEAGYRHLVVVDGSARAVGMVSAVDVIRGLLALPGRHPEAFARFDAETGLIWSDERTFDAAAAAEAPSAPGLLALVHAAPAEPSFVVWVEDTLDLRSRLVHLLGHSSDNPELCFWLEHPEHLHYRYVVVTDSDRRILIEATLRARLEPDPRPAW